ncbi:hypothetical protein CHL78_006755 [Romboutsia weinsteinii]|uniref:Uncharacterized protein n=1 Tax=Romboutsia weinsteinii TaxID=2020949 RepID=A0A371J5P0_9FIRM|nr:hypothetical protein [Romboutsia weinsteinii]RDY27997.1 hypothetical protein CHL78_006755 [Romboutsia weinsteinii]
MPKNPKSIMDCDISQYCNNVANQYIFLVSIYAAIISQEIENDEDLGILGSFLVALGEELSLASEIRIACKAEFKEDTSEPEEIEDVFDRSIPRKRYIKKIKKRYSKRR